MSHTRTPSQERWHSSQGGVPLSHFLAFNGDNIVIDFLSRHIQKYLLTWYLLFYLSIFLGFSHFYVFFNTHLIASHVCMSGAWCLQRSEKGVGSQGAEVINGVHYQKLSGNEVLGGRCGVLLGMFHPFKGCFVLCPLVSFTVPCFCLFSLSFRSRVRCWTTA